MYTLDAIQVRYMKKTKIDKLGRIVLPIHYRRLLNITTESELTIHCDGSKILIYPSQRICRICDKEIKKLSSIPLCDDCIKAIKENSV